MFFLCVGLVGLFATSVYLNRPEGNLLRQLCLNSIPTLKEARRIIPVPKRISQSSVHRRVRVCEYQAQRFERGYLIKTYALGLHILEYELDKWLFFRADVDRLRGAYLTSHMSSKQFRLKISLGPKNGNLRPDFLEDRYKRGD